MATTPHPYRCDDPVQALGLAPEAPLDQLATALQTQAPAWAASPRSLCATLLRFPWFLPAEHLGDDANQAWLVWRMALATHRGLWDAEESKEPAEHDRWVEVLLALIDVLRSPGLEAALGEWLAAATQPLEAAPLAAAVQGARADLMVELLLDPVALQVAQHPKRYSILAAQLELTRALGETGQRAEDHRRLLLRVLQAGGLLWLEVDRPDRAALLLEELLELDPDAAAIRHYALRARVMQAVGDLGQPGAMSLPGAAQARLSAAIRKLEDLADEAPYHFELRTQLADLYLHQGREAIEAHRASESAESLVKAVVADMAWPGCAAMAGDVEGSMHAAKLVGGLGKKDPSTMREAEASEQLKAAIRTGISRGEMYLARERPWRLFETWTQAEAARLWHDLRLPLDTGVFPERCGEWLAPLLRAPLPPDDAPPLPSPALLAELGALLPDLPPTLLEGPLQAFATWALDTRRRMAAPLSLRDLLFLHRLRDRAPVAEPLGEGPWARPVLGFGLEETSAGPVVVGVRAEGPGGQAGLQDGDRIVALRGFPCPNAQRVVWALLGWQPGEALPLRVARGREQLSLQLSPQEHRTIDALPRADFGQRCERLLGLRFDEDGTVRNAPRVAMFCQLDDGDRVLRVEGRPVAGLRELEEMLRVVPSGQFLLFTALRDGHPRLAKVITLGGGD